MREIRNTLFILNEVGGKMTHISDYELELLGYVWDDENYLLIDDKRIYKIVGATKDGLYVREVNDTDGNVIEDEG